MKITRTLMVGLLAGASLFTACDKDEVIDYTSEFNAAEENYAELVYASYEDSYKQAEKLHNAIDKFVANPTQANMEAAREQWLEARVPYGQTEAYRFQDGPIDDEDGPEGLINAWPMDESYIDYVQGNPTAGIINMPEKYPSITPELLVELNEAGGETNVSTGWHAIEFLLWGQDFYSGSPGKRSYLDYVDGEVANADRRGEYLKVVADLLLKHLGEVKDEWAPNGTYRKEFLSLGEDETIKKIFGSLKEMSKGELAGERMLVAVEENDQEQEHSCFADNTHVDILENFNGLVNVYHGSYTTTDGKTISGESYADIAKEVAPEDAAEVEEAINTARTRIKAIPIPFDQAILNNKDEIRAAVKALQDLSDAFADVESELLRV